MPNGDNRAAARQDPNKRYLTDVETKRLLVQYHIPVAAEFVASSATEAAELARQIPGPVVLKVISPDVLHKTEAGGVRINVSGDEAVRQAADEIRQSVLAHVPHAKIEGILVQEYIPQGIELIAGIAPDPAFGHAVMFGLGGIFVEVLRDVAFRVVPLSQEDASAMIREIRGLPILRGARGRAPVDLDALASILLALSRLAEEQGDKIAELDINPLLARPDGSLVAIDSRAALSPIADASIIPSQPPLDMAALDRVLNPQRLAIIGASNSPDKIGYLLMNDLVRRGYRGDLYPVNPRGGDILGLPAYATVNDIPTPVDLAIVAVPPEAIPQVLRDCAQKEVPGVLINTAGFGETGTAEGRALEREVLQIARDAHMRIIGPNCLGIYNPRLSVGFLDIPELAGPVSVISQSGSMTARIVKFGIEHGIGFSKAVSSGNELDLNLTDYIEYFGQDRDTEIIVAYVESIRDGMRFMQVARRVAARKPILIWKAGRTEAGAQAAASHTGALVSSTQVYNAAFLQSGVIAVGSFTALMDGLILIARLGFPTGDRIAIVTGPGGMGVALADACNDLGLAVPALAPETRRHLQGVLPSFASTRNPIDITMAQIVNPDLSRQCMRIVDEDPNTDAIITVIAGGDPLMMSQVVLRAKPEVRKPLLVLMNDPPEETKSARLELEKAGIPVYDHPERAAQALAVALREPSVAPR